MGYDKLTVEALKKELRLATQNRKKLRIYAELSDRFYLSEAVVALDYAREAWKCAKALSDDGDDRALALLKYGRCLNKTSEHAQARELLIEAIRIYRSTGNTNELGKALNLLANTYLSTAEYPKALTHYTEALEITEQTGDEHTREMVLGNIGLLYRSIGDYYRSFQYQSQAFELALKLGVSDLTAGYLNLAITYWELNQPDKAREYLEKSYESAVAAGDIIGIQKSLSNLSEIDLTNGDLTAALDKAERSRVIAKEQDFRSEEAKITVRIATIQLRREEYSDALRNLKHAMKLAEDYQLDALYPTILGMTSQILVQQRKWDDAESSLTEGIPIARKHGAKQDEADMERLFSDVLAARGDFERALEHFRRYAELRDELFKHDQQQLVVQAHIRLEVETAVRQAEEHRRERERLEHELALKQQELAAIALQIAKQNEALGKLTGQLKTASGGAQTSSVLREIDRIRTNDNEWKVFESQFDTLHAGFTGKLLEKYPALTPKEVRVCALMKLNLTSKDIAGTLAISERTVEVHRLQIRKKMRLRQTDNLSTKLATL
jgi:tetratricopeptide (TPR) repeat protein/DNA-binding CsgD family transcriptional regulator